MHRWSEIAEQVSGTTRTSEKVRLLAEYLRDLGPDDLRLAAVFFTGRPFPEADQRALGLGWAAVSAAVALVLEEAHATPTAADAGVPAGAAFTDLVRAALGRAYDRSSDIGTAVSDVLGERVDQPDPETWPSLTEVAGAFAAIEAASGPSRKAALFAALLARCDALAARYVVRVLSGDLRIGLKEGLLEAGIAAAYGRPLASVQWAGMLTGDAGETAVLARHDRLDDARLRLFHPLKFMLATPAEDASEIVRRLGPTVWVEDKYDGIRAQLHRQESRVALFSRDLHDVTGQFPEVAEAARGLPWDGILDGEILGFADGRVLPFLALQARLGRKRPPADLLESVPVIFVAFDLLAFGRPPAVPEPVLHEPLEQRRRRLEGLELPLVDEGGRFVLSRLVTAASAEELDSAFLAARARRNEGLMVKDPASTYSPGRRGYGWLKMKRALATIDCVVVGVEVGHGKRHGVLSDYTFAVRDAASDRLVTIGKAYSGLTDLEIAEMTRWFEAHTISRHGRYRVVEPTVVVEVAFDVIMRSNRHQSGYALRFPRIAAIRTDKPPAEIDTLETVDRLYRELQHGSEYLVTAAARKATPDPP